MQQRQQVVGLLLMLSRSLRPVHAAYVANWSSAPLTAPGAVCINGGQTAVQYFKNPVPSTVWVLTIGATSPGLGAAVCVSEQTCAMFAAQKIAPAAPPGPPSPLQPSGPQSTNCTINPSWCGANQAMLPICDFALGLGDRVHTFNGTTMYFAGQNVTTAALSKLATLGLSNATDVLLNGVTLGGTAAVLSADRIGAQLKMLAPGLKRYKVLPVDALHPKFNLLGVWAFGPHSVQWAQSGDAGVLTKALDGLANISGALTGIPPGCTAPSGCDQANHNLNSSLPCWNTGYCLRADESLKYVKTPMFLVQQMPGVFDYQCLYDGAAVGCPGPECILQTSCSMHGGRRFMGTYDCVQYIDVCSPDIVRNFSVPLQQKYLDVYKAAGGHTRAGGGGFMHGCYLGSYFFETYGKSSSQINISFSGVWNQIAVGGKTMQLAISQWWDAEASAPGSDHFYADTPWNASGSPPTAPSSPSRRGTSTSHDIVDHPGVPWYTSRFFTNPTCRGYPWY